MVYCLSRGLQSTLTHVNVNLRASSPFGGVARCRARTAREKRQGCESASPLAGAFSRSYVNEANARKWQTTTV